MILACKDISKSYGTDTILEKITFNLEEKEKAAVVGVNGAGKTTLFKIITDKISYDSGQIYIPKDTTIGYLEQNIDIRSEKTIYEEMLSVFDSVFSLERRLREMEKRMSSLTDNEYSSFMEQYSRLQQEFEEMDGYSCKSRINGVLKGLGFSEEEYSQQVFTLSGGQKTRVFLGKLLLMRPDLLLLDEPTNHLDIESIQWLEDFLKGLKPDEIKAECLLPVMVNDLLASGEMTVLATPSHDKWFGITYKADKEDVENKLKALHESGVYPPQL